MTIKGRQIESFANKSDGIYGAHNGCESSIEGHSLSAKVTLDSTHRMQNSRRHWEFLHEILVGRISVPSASYANNTHRREIRLQS